MGKLLDHDKFTRDDTLEMVVDYMGTDLKDAIKEL